MMAKNIPYSIHFAPSRTSADVVGKDVLTVLICPMVKVWAFTEREAHMIANIMYKVTLGII